MSQYATATIAAFIGAAGIAGEVPALYGIVPGVIGLVMSAIAERHRRGDPVGVAILEGA